MKRIATLIAGTLLLFGCAGTPATTTTTGVTPASVCADITAVQAAPDAAAQLAKIDPHSALGVVWADVQSGCVAGVPVAGVSASWTAVVWGMAKTLIPQVLPSLLPFIVGLL